HRCAVGHRAGPQHGDHVHQLFTGHARSSLVQASRYSGIGASMVGMIFDGFSHQLPDTDPEETAEWVDGFQALVEEHGKTRASFLLMKLLERARQLAVGFPATVSTPYINTIPPEDEPWFPGDEYMERRIRAYIRWNAAVMVTRANTL